MTGAIGCAQSTTFAYNNCPWTGGDAAIVAEADFADVEMKGVDLDSISSTVAVTFSASASINTSSFEFINLVGEVNSASNYFYTSTATPAYGGDLTASSGKLPFTGRYTWNVQDCYSTDTTPPLSVTGTAGASCSFSTSSAYVTDYTVQGGGHHRKLL